MMNQGQKFFHKFMKQACKDEKKKGKCEEKEQEYNPMRHFFKKMKKMWMMNKMGKGSGRCPFKNFEKSNMPECAKKWLRMMNPHTQQKKSDEPKSVDQMTEEEQLAHAIKLSMEKISKPESKKEKKEKKKAEKEKKKAEKKAKKAAKKAAKKVSETPKTSTPKSVSDLSFEDQLAEAMRLSLEDQVPKNSKLEDDVVIMNESESKDEESSENTEELYEDTPKPTEPKKVVVVEEVDPVVLSNTTQLMAICGVPENRKADVQKWVAAKAKQGQAGINELLNMFLDEMSGRL